MSNSLTAGHFKSVNQTVCGPEQMKQTNLSTKIRVNSRPASYSFQPEILLPLKWVPVIFSDVLTRSPFVFILQ